MSCALGYPGPSTDLTQSQFLRPKLSTQRLAGASSTRAGRNHHRRAYTEQEVVYSDAFRNGLLFLAGQVISELNRSKDIWSDSRVQVPSAPHQTFTSFTSAPISYNKSTHISRESYSPLPIKSSSQYIKKELHSASCRGTSPAPARRKGLNPPRPRLSSPLSPNAPGTVLPAPTYRHPMPSSRKKDECLYRVVLEKSVLRPSSTAKAKLPFVYKNQKVLDPKLSGIDGVDSIDGCSDVDCDMSKVNSESHPGVVENNSDCLDGGSKLSDSWVVVVPQSTWDVVSLEDAIF